MIINANLDIGGTKGDHEVFDGGIGLDGWCQFRKETRGDVTVGIVRKEARTRDVDTSRVSIEVVGRGEVVADGVEPGAMLTLLQVDGDDPFETVAGGGREEEESLKMGVGEQQATDFI